MKGKTGTNKLAYVTQRSIPSTRFAFCFVPHTRSGVVRLSCCPRFPHRACLQCSVATYPCSENRRCSGHDWGFLPETWMQFGSLRHIWLITLGVISFRSEGTYADFSGNLGRLKPRSAIESAEKDCFYCMLRFCDWGHTTDGKH